MREQLGKLLKSSWPLLIILGIYLLLVSINSWATPPFEGPDEPQHYAYIEWLVEQNGFPPQGKASWDTPVQQESSQPPLYYLLASVPARLVGVVDPRAEYRPNPHPLKGFPLTYADNDNRAVHYPSDASPIAGGWLALYLARAITAAFGLLLIISVYGLARQAVPDQREVAIAASFLVATIPQVVFLSGLVSNDIPAAAMSTVTLWMLAALMRKGHARLLAVGIGVAFGLSALLKVSALTLAVPIGFVLIWLFFSRQQTWRHIVRTSLLIFLGLLLTAGWWFVRSWLLFGSPLGLETHDQAPWAIDDPATLVGTRFRWVEVFRSFWIWLGWGTVRPHDAYYYIFFALVVIALIGLAIALWRRRKSARTRPDITAAIFVMLLSAMFTTAIFLEIWMRRVTAPYGRLMYPVIGVVAIFLVIGWRAIHPKLPIIPLAITLVTALLAPFLLLKPAYALPQFLDETEVAEKSKTNWFFGESQDQLFAELLSVTPLEKSMVSDSLLPVELCWRAIDQAEEDYSVMVHIIGPDNSLISNRRTYPGLGRYPTSIWQPGTAWCDLIHILVNEKAITETLVYKIEVGMLNPELDGRLSMFSSTGEPLGAAFAGDIIIAPDGEENSAPLENDEIISLLDHEVGLIWEPDQANEFALTWSVSTPLPDDYQLFVHLRDTATGESVAQADGPPLDGWYPTSRWLPQTRITDERTFYLPSEIDPGSYDLVVGFYDLATGERIGREYSLETIQIQP